VSENGAYPNEMNEVALFTTALRAAVPAQPDPGAASAIVPRLAATARSSTIEAETRRSRPSEGLRPGRLRSRRALLAVVAAVAVIPLLVAGLAVAGVTVPAPARDAFRSVGITLPHQARDHVSAPETGEGRASQAEEKSGGNDVSKAATAKPAGRGGNSAAAHEHARKQRERAQGKAKGHDQGKAIGLNGSTPPGHSGETGPPAHSNAGGNGSGSSAGHPTGKPPTVTPAPNGVANGHTKVPPGHSK
jgi:hypothetical protein